MRVEADGLRMRFTSWIKGADVPFASWQWFALDRKTTTEDMLAMEIALWYSRPDIGRRISGVTGQACLTPRKS
jgi:hypothetical protein